MIKWTKAKINRSEFLNKEHLDFTDSLSPWLRVIALPLFLPGLNTVPRLCLFIIGRGNNIIPITNVPDIETLESAPSPLFFLQPETTETEKSYGIGEHQEREYKICIDSCRILLWRRSSVNNLCELVIRIANIQCNCRELDLWC